MKIQIIGEGFEKKPGFNGITLSPLSAPRSLDEFDINVISLNSGELWEYDGADSTSINKINDFVSIQSMVKNRSKSRIIYAMPQNHVFYYAKMSNGYYKHIPIKDRIRKIWELIIAKILYPQFGANVLQFENTRTTVGNQEYTADFYLRFSDSEPEKKVLTKSNSSEKVTTVLLDEKTVLTTLDITSSSESLKNFIQEVCFPKEKSPAPEWALAIQFGDDPEQRNIISEKEEEIKKAKADIECAKQKLEANSKYKSILYTNGDELVSVVFEMLEKLLGYDLSEFQDEKREDFLIKKDGRTFIGEIKGVTSNVRYDHITQIELHYRSYLDDLEEEHKQETIKQLLIINAFRTKPLEEREPVHTAQIELAKRNDCLIIETTTLLRIFEKYCAGEISAEICENVFASRNGLLSLKDFEVTEEGD